MTINAIVQARISSTRLPGKVLLNALGRPFLSHMVERVRMAKKIDNVILATSLEQSDDSIADFCKQNKILCYRGNLNDVLDRYYQAAKEFNTDIVVRLTGDCPLIDPQIIDDVINTYEKVGYDYVANTLPPKWTVPEGMDVEVFSFKNLERAWREAKKPSDREHVTFYLWHNPQLFSVYRYNLPQDLSNYRLTLDYKEDFEVIKAIIENLYPKKPLFTMYDIINFLNSNPHIHNLNKNIQPNLGWQSAFEKDKKAGFK